MSAALALALMLTPPARQVSELLRAGDAGHAYSLLAEQLDDERMKPGEPAAQFLANMLRYLRCEDTRPATGAGTPDRDGFAAAGALFPVERLRVLRRRRERQPSGPEEWIASGRLRWTVPAQPATDERTIHWPPSDERWSDETMVVAAPAVACPGTDRTAGGADGAGRDGGADGARRDRSPGPARARRSGRQLLSDESEAVRAMRLRLAAGAPVRVALLLDEAVVRARLGEWSEVWVLVRLLDEEAERPGAGPLGDDEAIEHLVLSGLAAEEEGRGEEAEVRWERAARLRLSEEQRQFVALHTQRLLVAAGRFADARKVLDDAAATSGTGEVGRYLKFRGALVRFRQGDAGALLASARELLGMRPAAQIAADPIARATDELVQLSLAAYAFGPALVEVVESLGPVSELYRRLDALASVAFDHGRDALAAAIYRWLLEHHRLYYLRPYYLGRLAAAAAAQGDASLFGDTFHALIEESLPPHPPMKAPRTAHRRSVEWDRQVLLATRDVLAALAARHDQASLRLLVAQLQRYLRAAGEKPPYAELTRLYRLASTQTHGARGYAEKVGAEHAPVWLGNVTLDRPRREVPEPAIAPPPMYGPETLICIPDGSGACPRWLGPPPPAPRAEVSRAR